MGTSSHPPVDVFLSYNSKDRPAVDQLVQALRSHGLTPWFAESDRSLGTSWVAELDEVILTTKSAAILIGPHGLTEWQKREANALLVQSTERQIGIISVLLPGTTDKSHLPPLLASHPLVDLRPGLSDEAVAEVILRITGRRPPFAARESERQRAAAQRISPSRLPPTTDLIIGRDAELQRLYSAWSTATTHVLTIVGPGGIGKSALLSHFAAQLAARNYDGADYFDWPFYLWNSDEFIATALAFFGDPKMANSPASPWDKGSRLAQLIAQRRTLLILDGLERYQHPPTAPANLAGQLKDPALSALLRGLAQRNPGLCLITTRQPLTDLPSLRDTSAPELNLSQLSTEASVALLKHVGVHGAQSQFESLVHDVGGDPLTLRLLGRYLVDVHHGDVTKRPTLREWEAASLHETGSSLRALGPILNSYRNHLNGTPELEVLYLLSLLDDPIDPGLLAFLRRPPAIPGLTELTSALDEQQWASTVLKLRDLTLIEPLDPHRPDILKSHPDVREYFRESFQREFPIPVQELQRRVVEYNEGRAEPLSLYVDLDTYSEDEVVAIIECLSSLYESMTGDHLVIDSQGLLEPSSILEPVEG